MQDAANWISRQARMARVMIANPQLLTLLIVLDVAAYFGGLLFWYAYVMADMSTPIWTWPFIPDCPLFGLLGGIGLLMVIGERFWSSAARRQGELTILIAGGVCAIIWLSSYLPGVGPEWQQHRAMFGLLSAVLLLSGALFRRAPRWLLGLFALGQIKYGVWTVTAWMLFWRSTAETLGTPLFTFDSIAMTVTHLGLIAQGLLLLTFFRPGLAAAGVSFAWFAASDYVDYGLGYYPALPEDMIPLVVMQWSTVAMTLLLSGLYVWSGISRRWIDLSWVQSASIEEGLHPTRRKMIVE